MKILAPKLMNKDHGRVKPALAKEADKGTVLARSYHFLLTKFNVAPARAKKLLGLA